ncbi:MAG: hypothetical protein CSA84_00215 [Actinomycetales bacterium]|nr:MAG: hypothetical protein CSA84_00215 [Actinomycetales bacterium]
MNLRYLQYCTPASPYFERGDNHPDYAATEMPLPIGWERELDSDWCYMRPPRSELPGQGWKIHVSATLDDAESTLGVVSDYCIERGILLKFIRSPWVLVRRNSKYGDRSASGKFITVFPHPDRLADALDELDQLLGGRPGPYILSDLRYRNGPLYVRYGGFARLTTIDENGQEVYCIRDPEGRMVPDERRPVFRPPSWVDVPECLTESLAARNAATLKGFPYRAVRALHFSNGGGVYDAIDTKANEHVLLKEGRPLAGLDEQGRDAVARLEREHWAMDRLADLPVVPQIRDVTRGHLHHYLVRDLVPGRSLADVSAERNPLMGGPGALSPEGFVAWIEPLLARIGKSVVDMHDRGVVFGDLHPNNVLVDATDQIAFIDFEGSSAVEDRARQSIGAPGFRAPVHYAGVETDYYGLGCLRLSCYLPVTVSIVWDIDRVEQILATIVETFPVPPDFASLVRANLAGAAAPGVDHEEGNRTRPDDAGEPRRPRALTPSDLIAGIVRAQTPDNDERLFPGDVHQFLVPGGSVSFGTGAAGVLYALARHEGSQQSCRVRWLLDRIDDPTLRPGCYDGLSGIAFALDRLGRSNEAARCLERAVVAWEQAPRGLSLFDGAAGLALALLDFGGRHARPDHVDRADRVLSAALDAHRGPLPGGLFYGWAGVALARLRLFEATDDEKHLAGALEAMQSDLGVLGWSAGAEAGLWSHPVLGVGGAGSAMVLHDLRRYAAGAPVLEAFYELAEPLGRRWARGAGLVSGRAGTMLALAHCRSELPWADAALDRHAKDLSWHVVPWDGAPSVLGENGLKLSCDFATGSAGVLLALEAVQSRSACGLPFFDVSHD